MSATRHPVSTSHEQVLEDLRQAGEKPYWIPSGASTHRLGGLGFARFAFELAAQEEELGVFSDTIVVACNSGSTLEGMIAGFKILERITGAKRRRLIGVDTPAAPDGHLARLVLQSANATAELINPECCKPAFTDKDINVDTRFNAGAYGRVDERTLAAMKLLASTDGVVTDPVYTGKALTGLVEMMRNGELSGSENVLFVHTGGTMVLSAYPTVR